MEPSRDIRAPKPAHATVVAYLALFVALSGTATAIKGVNQVKRDDIAKGAVSRAKIAPKAVNAQRLAPRSVTTSRLVPGAVTNRILAFGAVTSEKIADGGVGPNDIAAAAVGGGKIAKSAVGGGELKSGAVGAGKIKDGAVGELKIADSAVTTTKLKASAVTGAKVAAGTLPVGKLSSPVMTAGAPFAAGLGRPNVEFVDFAHADPGQNEVPILAVKGLGTILGYCDAGDGSRAGLRNDASVPQRIFSEQSDGAVSFGEAVPAGGAVITPGITGGGPLRFTFFSHEPASGRSAYYEVFASHSPAEGCDFYAFSIAR